MYVCILSLSRFQFAHDLLEKRAAMLGASRVRKLPLAQLLLLLSAVCSKVSNSGKVSSKSIRKLPLAQSAVKAFASCLLLVVLSFFFTLRPLVHSKICSQVSNSSKTSSKGTSSFLRRHSSPRRRQGHSSRSNMCTFVLVTHVVNSVNQALLVAAARAQQQVLTLLALPVQKYKY